MHYGWAKRLMSRELLLMCERNGIRLAMPQIVINESVDDSKKRPDKNPHTDRAVHR